MKGKLIFVSIILIIFIAVNNSCNIDRCFGSGIGGESLSINFKNAAGVFLYSGNTFNNPYLKDSLKIFNENNLPVSFQSTSEQDSQTSLTAHYKFWVEVYNQNTDSKAFETEVCKTLYFKHHYNETDTIKACFKVFKNKCGTASYEYLNIYYKRKLVGSISNQQYIEVMIAQ